MSDTFYFWLMMALAITSLVMLLLYLASPQRQSLANGTSPSLLLQGQRWWARSKGQNRSFFTNVTHSMRQAGYLSNREQVMVMVKLLVLWLGLMVAAQFFFSASSTTNQLLFLLLMIGVGLWMPIRWFDMRAAKRAKQMDNEMLLTVHLMSILWQVGLSIETMLRAYVQEAQELTPEVNREIGLILARIEAGQNRESAFNEAATVSRSSGFQEMLIMLSQIGETGGGLQQSFKKLALLLQDRKRTELQEKVTKMSGKISVIMMTFLFPPLFVVLGGPAALALASAFSHQ